MSNRTHCNLARGTQANCSHETAQVARPDIIPLRAVRGLNAAQLPGILPEHMGSVMRLGDYQHALRMFLGMLERLLFLGRHGRLLFVFLGAVPGFAHDRTP